MLGTCVSTFIVNVALVVGSWNIYDHKPVILRCCEAVLNILKMLPVLSLSNVHSPILWSEWSCPASVISKSAFLGSIPDFTSHYSFEREGCLTVLLLDKLNMSWSDNLWASLFTLHSQWASCWPAVVACDFNEDYSCNTTIACLLPFFKYSLFTLRMLHFCVDRNVCFSCNIILKVFFL